MQPRKQELLYLGRNTSLSMSTLWSSSSIRLISFAGDTLFVYPLTSRLSAARACTKRRQAGPGLRLRRCSTYTCAVGLARASAKRVSLALGCVTGFHSENRRFEAPVAVREKEGERLRGLTARTPTEGGVGRHTSRRQESDRPEGGSGPPRGQTTDRRGGPHELGWVGTK